MTTTNPHTGDALRTKLTTPAYDEGYERIWGKKPDPKPAEPAPPAKPK